MDNIPSVGGSSASVHKLLIIFCILFSVSSWAKRKAEERLAQEEGAESG